MKTDNTDILMNAIAVLWINLYYLEIYCNEQVEFGRKIDQGSPAMFLPLPLLNTCSNGWMFCISNAW